MRSPNNLINEKSPYLLQHAYNPVNWYPWNDKTLSIAKEKQLPIFLSIGYSTCYWCHVMERESFENPEIAKLMNEYFINIKVDREERPDIDRVYMTALQSITGSGGWPMSIFLTPDLRPFYAATYIPPKAKYGRSGIEDVFTQINDLWKNRREEVLKSSEKIFAILNKNILPGIREDNQLNSGVFNKFFDSVKNIYDYENSGFGDGNKFPRPVVFDFLLKYYFRTEDVEALDMVTHTLKKMYKGGVNDHLEFGFHRYSVDKYWRVPHFEKMLYDQAQITISYIEVYKITKDKFFLNAAMEILGYVLNFLTSESGGFYSAEDAESTVDLEHPDMKEEGYFYLWKKSDIDKILNKNESEIFNFSYGIKFEGNTLNDPHNIFQNKNVLYIANDIYETAKYFKKTPDEINTILTEAKRKINLERNKRIRPSLDKKILTSWNGLMISAFAMGYEVTHNEKYLLTAKRCSDFIFNKMYNGNVLFHRYIDNEIKYKGTLEDYAFFIKGLISLYEINFDVIYLTKAIELTDTAIKYFYDNEFGGFFDTDYNSEDLILKTKDIYDGAEPSANSIMLENLLKLNIFSEGKLYEEIAMKSFEYFWNNIEKFSFSHPRMLCALDFYLNSAIEIIITKGENELPFNEMLKLIYQTYIPNRILIMANEDFEKHFPIIKKLVTEYNKTKVYICRDFKCEIPATDIETLKSQLEN